MICMQYIWCPTQAVQHINPCQPFLSIAKDRGIISSQIDTTLTDGLMVFALVEVGFYVMHVLIQAVKCRFNPYFVCAPYMNPAEKQKETEGINENREERKKLEGVVGGGGGWMHG